MQWNLFQFHYFFSLEVGAGCAVVLVEAEAVLVDVIEDGDEHCHTSKEEQRVGPEGTPAQVPVEQTARTEDGEGQGNEQANATVEGVDGVVAKGAQHADGHQQAEEARNEKGDVVKLLFHHFNLRFDDFLDKPSA